MAKKIEGNVKRREPKGLEDLSLGQRPRNGCKNDPRALKGREKMADGPAPKTRIQTVEIPTESVGILSPFQGLIYHITYLYLGRCPRLGSVRPSACPYLRPEIGPAQRENNLPIPNPGARSETENIMKRDACWNKLVTAVWVRFIFLLCCGVEHATNHCIQYCMSLSVIARFLICLSHFFLIPSLRFLH